MSRHIPHGGIPRGYVHATALTFPEPSKPMASPMTNGINNATSRNRTILHFWKMHENAWKATVKPGTWSRSSFSFSFDLSIYKICLHNFYFFRSKETIRRCKSTKDLRNWPFQSLHHFAPTSAPRHIPGDLPLELPLPWKTHVSQERNPGWLGYMGDYTTIIVPNDTRIIKNHYKDPY